jgi:hypothetical protein
MASKEEIYKELKNNPALLELMTLAEDADPEHIQAVAEYLKYKKSLIHAENTDQRQR